MSKFMIAKLVAAAKRQRILDEFRRLVLVSRGVEVKTESLNATAKGGNGAGLMAYTKALWESVKNCFEEQ